MHVLTSHMAQFDTGDSFESILDIIQSKMAASSASIGEAGLFMPDIVANVPGSVVRVRDWETCRTLSTIHQSERESKGQPSSQGVQQEYLTFIWVNVIPCLPN